LYWILFVFLFFLVLYIFSYSYVQWLVDFSMKQGIPEIKLTFKALYGLWSYRMHLGPYHNPASSFPSNETINRKVSSKSMQNLPLLAQNSKQNTLKAYIFDTRRLLFIIHHTDLLYEGVRKGLKKTEITLFRWHTEIGVNHAPLTAQCAGFLLTFKYCISSLLARSVKHTVAPQFYVNSNYSRSQFVFDFHFHARIRLGSLMMIFIRLFFKMMKKRQNLIARLVAFYKKNKK
jgi:hypothetical protein